MARDLALVMPVYNESGCIEQVINAWLEALEGLGLDFRMIVLNDGSSDNTAEILARFEGDQRLNIINKANTGHGPTILMGYGLAVKEARWVFQCDSDDEIEAKWFEPLWSRRQGYDALFGVRTGRVQGAGRAAISAVSRATVRLLFGPGVQDVNTPFRLMRAPLLARIISQIPGDTFAPNVIISGAFAAGGARIYNHPVPHLGRRTGAVSIVKWKLVKSAARSFWQTLRCRPTLSGKRDG